MHGKNCHRPSAFHRGLGLLAILVLSVRSLIAPGFMVAAVDGRAELVICPAGLHIHHAARVHHAAGHDTGAIHGAALGHAGEQCPFALAGGFALSGATPTSAQPYFVLVQRPSIVAHDEVTRRPPFRYQAPRGPPVLV